MDTGADELQLAVNGTYSPCVLYGSSNWKPGTIASGETAQLLPSYVLLAVEEGVHRVKTGTGIHRLDVGSVCLLPPGYGYMHRVAPRSRVLYVVFNVVSVPLTCDGDPKRTFALKLADGAMMQPQPREVWGAELPAVLPPAVSGLAVRELRSLCDVWWRGQHGRFRANHHLSEILYALASPASSQGQASVIQDTDSVTRAMALLVGRPPPASVEEWAQSVGLHRSQFGRRFRAEKGVPPGEFLRGLRLRRAEDLLRSTTEPVSHIAYEAGYRNVSALDHAFRAEHGSSPSLWRQRRLG